MSSSTMAMILDVVLAVGGMITTWAIHQGAQWLKSRTHDIHTRRLIDRLDDSVEVAVKAIEQTARRALKGPAAGDNANALKFTAIEMAEKSMGDIELKELSRRLSLSSNQIRSMVEAKVEAKVHDLKAKGSAS